MYILLFDRNMLLEELLLLYVLSENNYVALTIVEPSQLSLISCLVIYYKP